MTTKTIARVGATLGLAALLTAGLAEPAFAATGAGNIGSFIQNVVDILNNNVVRGLAIIAIIVTGIAFMFGHVDLRRAGQVVLGIIVVFGAAGLVDLITGGGTGA